MYTPPWPTVHRGSPRRKHRFGITADLDTVSAFFVELGVEVEGRTFLEGEFLDTVIGIPNSRTEMVMQGSRRAVTA
jgi:hypothetical protein